MNGLKKWASLAIGLVVAALVVSMCSRGPGEPTADADRADHALAARRVINHGLGPEPESLDPHKARTAQAAAVQRDIFEGLMVYTPDGELEGGVAEDWKISDDGLEYRFWLKPEARWSNGDPVTADDFVFSFRRLIDPKTAAFFANVLAPVVNAEAITAGSLPPDQLGVEAAGPHELVIHLHQPTPYFLQLMTQAATLPVHSGSIAEHGDAFARPGNLIGNGAYRLADWSLGSLLELRRNEYFRDDANTALDRVRYHVAEEPSTELYRFRAGELDTTSTIPTASFELVKEEMPDQVRVSPGLATYFYGLNLNQPVLADSPELREALSLVIDRDVIAKQVVARGEIGAYTSVPPGIANYESPRPAMADMTMEERIRRAQRLYVEAGYGPDNPLEIELRYNTSGTHQRVAVTVQDMWKEALGFEAKLINVELKVLIENARAMKITEIFRLGWRANYNDAHSFLQIFQTDDPSNMFGYSNEEFDAQMDAAAAQSNLDRRRLYLEEAERVLQSDWAVIPIYFPTNKHLVSLVVKGWQDNVPDYHYSRHLSLEPDR